MKFFNNEERLKITLLAILKRGHNLKFVSTVEEVFSNAVIEEIDNKKCKELVSMINSAINGVSKGIYKANLLFDYAKGNDDDLNTEIESRIEEPLDNDFFDNLQQYYANLKLKEPLLRNVEDIIDLKSKIEATGIDIASSGMEELQDIVREINEGLNAAMSTKEGKTLEFDEDRIIGFAETMNEMNITEDFKLKSNCAIDKHFGGFSPTKLYNFVGVPGGGKSLTLLNLALKFRENNEFDEEVLEGRTPIVLYVTLENTREQTLSRVMSYYGIEKPEFQMMSITERKNTLMEYLGPKNKNDIRLSIKAFKRYTIGGGDLLNLIKDYENRGHKVLALVVDYLDLIEFNYSEEDRHNSKMPIVKKAEDLKTLANQLHVPVITASQTNRSGEAAIKEAKNRGKNVVDPIKSLNASHIAAGYQIKGEVDFLAFVYSGDFNGKYYLAIKEDKKRDKVDNKNKDKMSVMPLEGFKISETETYKSASEMFPDDLNTVNILSKGNRRFKDVINEREKEKKERRSNTNIKKDV